jgi:hypothetical protein
MPDYTGHTVPLESEEIDALIRAGEECPFIQDPALETAMAKLRATQDRLIYQAVSAAMNVRR